jgi:Cof subfamily protein (haloacid dehalogenase superfamily)
MKRSFPLAPIRLLLIDVDGTLVGHDFEVRPRVKSALIAAHERGVQIALCTGRPQGSSMHYVVPLNLTGYHIFDSGATISDPLSGQVLYQSQVPNDVAMQMLHHAREHNLYVEVYTPGHYYVGYASEHSRMHAQLQRWEPEVVDLAEVIAHEPVSKLEAVALNASEVPSIQRMLDLFNGQIDYGWAIVPGMETHFVNILATGISKGDAVGRLVEHYGISPDQAMGAGDGPNDIPLLQAVGFGVAMGNATDALKNVASWVAPSVDEDGLAVAIEQFILNVEYRA